jgi:hypothetical protein
MQHNAPQAIERMQSRLARFTQHGGMSLQKETVHTSDLAFPDSALIFTPENFPEPINQTHLKLNCEALVDLLVTSQIDCLTLSRTK